MNLKQLKYTVILLYVIICLVCVLGLIASDIYLFVAATVLLVLTVPIQLNNPDIFQKEKRLSIGNQEAFKHSFYISNIIFFYVAILILTWRNTYPQYTIVGYTLLIVIFVECVIYRIIQKHNEKEYLK